jgi:hypothetical protein
VKILKLILSGRSKILCQTRNPRQSRNPSSLYVHCAVPLELVFQILFSGRALNICRYNEETAERGALRNTSEVAPTHAAKQAARRCLLPPISVRPLGLSGSTQVQAACDAFCSLFSIYVCRLVRVDFIICTHPQILGKSSQGE